ncbi:cell wall-binding repeat-containing protein [Agromyces sp. SYSU K20354]|uniref:cell wall-binding repeat-containing protein n=1 Tax=Agromyces cavernae TaxID=2898659 RepID=UPI001E332BDC|nr:cell wall-binding repeat-containing protein [Agromyces cavernae]MCD2443161.1 cell wall-binding repeat-containing protein [Agromyces cavernae]
MSVAPATDAEAGTVYCNPQPRMVQDKVERIAGADRYATAVAISRAGFAPRVCNIYIASGVGYADALAAAAEASGHSGQDPVLLVRPNSIPAEVVAEIKRLRPSHVTVMGGTGAVSDAVFNQLSALTENGDGRIAGSDRYATAAELYHGSAPVDTVYVASGQRFPDALAGAPYAGRNRWPLLLVPSTNAIPESVRVRLRDLRPRQIVILGGTGAVSAAVASGLKAYAGSVVRLAGTDRFATSVEVSKKMAPPGSYTVYIASGRDYPDALAIAPVASLSWAPVLLVERDSIPAVIGAELRRLQPRHIVVLGGTGAVSSDVERQLQEYLVAP